MTQDEVEAALFSDTPVKPRTSAATKEKATASGLDLVGLSEKLARITDDVSGAKTDFDRLLVDCDDEDAVDAAREAVAELNIDAFIDALDSAIDALTETRESVGDLQSRLEELDEDE
jgi:flagellin-like hook-associated protein FlgL